MFGSSDPAASPSPVQEVSGHQDAGSSSLAGGRIGPVEAWQRFRLGQARLVDVRSAEELTFVGKVPGAIHVPWAQGTALTRNPRFVRELESRVGKRDTVLLLCRSGKRSALAAQAAAKAGFVNVYPIDEGFEGQLDEQQQRGHSDGWRYRGLPWTQE